MKIKISLNIILFLMISVLFAGQNTESNSFSIKYDLGILNDQVKVFPVIGENFLTKYKKDSIVFKMAATKYKQGADIDESMQYVTIYERLFEEDYKRSIVMKFEDYVSQRLGYESKNQWHKSVTKGLGVGDYGGFLSGSGEISIDIPFKIKSRTFHRVFGGDKIGLRVKGSLSLSITGQKSYTDQANIDDSSFDFTLDQTQNISIRGKIGTKVDVDIAQNTEMMDFENSLKLTYTGESDEIIQKFEAGNIGLSLPGTRFVSYSGVNKGLFGVKAVMQIGKLKNTTIASFEKGQKNQLTIKGGVRSREVNINAKDYLSLKYFYIEDSFRENFASLVNYDRILEHQSIIGTPYQIQNYSFELYVTGTTNGTQAQADIYIDYLNRADSLTIGGIDNRYKPNQNVRLIESDQYEINNELGYIRLKSLHLSSGQILAARYIKQNSVGDTLPHIGRKVSNLKYELQIIAESGQSDTDPWSDLEWKNIYSLGGTDVSKDDFKLTISKEVSGTTKTEEVDSLEVSYPYLRWYEVEDDQANDLVDIGYLNSAYGEFRFPNQKPFAPEDKNSIFYDHGRDRADSIFVDPEVYTYTSSTFSSVFNLKFEITSKSSTYSLGFNVIEGSEVVRSGATELKKDVDYVIDYHSGQLSLINDLYQTADIEISYESASIFQMDEKVLLGNRFEYAFSEDTYIGGTVLYLSESTSEDRVHVGYEPKRNLTLDLNGQTRFDFPLLTKMIDKLPLIETDAKSSFSLEGEIAQIYPNPNPLDAAYIDDFENSKKNTSLGISYGAWHPASAPDEYDSAQLYQTVDLDGSMDSLNVLPYFLKAYSNDDEPAFYWYNPNDDDKLSKDEIYTDVPGEEKDDKVSTLDIIFKPTVTSNAIQGGVIQAEDSWGGVMKYLYSSYQDMREVKYIEFLATTNRTITLNIDIGELSEDVIPDGKLNTEDSNSNNVLDVLDDSEDIGLDVMSGANNSDYYQLFHDSLGTDRPKEDYEMYSFDEHPEESTGKPTPDSQLDNYWDFIKTEKNGRLDTEDLDGGGNLDKTIKAYRYTIDLRANPITDQNFVISTDYSAGSDFALYRIPLDYVKREILNNAPDMAKMKYIKLWVNNSTDVSNSTKIQFASLNLVGNEWAARGTSKGRIEAKTINNEDDKERYYSPPGVKKLDSDDFEEPEQSLLLDISLLFTTQEEASKGREAVISKNLITGENYLLYEEMKMFIHGGTEKDDQLWQEDRPTYFVYRFGSDSLNYYEYRSKLVAGWEDSKVNNQMVVSLNDFTELKTYRSDDNAPIDSMYMNGFKDEVIKRHIGILGNPTLQKVKYFNVGIIDSSGAPLDTEIWLDELRLVKVKKDPGMAMRAKTRIVMADIATIDAEITRQDGNFHRIEEKSGRGLTSQNFNLNTTFHLDKLVPQKLGLQLPIKYTHSNNSSYTKYQGSTDILVDENNIPDSVRTKTIRNQYDFSVKKTSKSNNPYIKHTLDKLSFSGNASFSKSSDATYISRESENYSYRVGYSLNLPESWFSFRPFGWADDKGFMKGMKEMKFIFFPSSYTTGLSTAKNQTVSTSRKGNPTKSQIFDVTRTLSTSIVPMPILNSSYNLTLKSNMYKARVDLDSLPDQDSIVVIDSYKKDFSDLLMLDFGELSNLESTTKNNLKLNFFKFWTNNLTLNTSYSWNGNLSSSKVSTNIKNRYDAKLGTKLKTKDIITGIQKSISYFLPKKVEENENIQQNNEPPKEEKSEEDKKPVDMRGARKSKTANTKNKKSVLDFLKTNLSDFSLSYSQNRENSYNDIKSFDQANLGFIFGVSSKPDGLDYLSSSWGGSWALTGSTRLSISKNLALDGIQYQFNRSYSENSNGFSGTDTETNFVWPWVTEEEHKKSKVNSFLIPNYSINVRGLEKLLKTESIRDITLSHAKSGSVSSAWYIDGNTPDMYLTGVPDLDHNILKVRSKSYNVSFRPLAGFKINFKNGFSFNTSYNYTYDMKESYSYNDGPIEVQSGDKKYTRELRMSSGYNQKGGFKIPFNFWPFNGRKLENDIRYNLTLSYNSSEAYKYDIEANEYEGYMGGVKSDNFTVSPDITYKISKKLSGTMSYSYNYNESQSYGARAVVNTNHKFELRASLSISGR